MSKNRIKSCSEKSSARARKGTLFLGAAQDFFFETEFHHQQIAYAADELSDILLNVQSLIDDDSNVFEQAFGVPARGNASSVRSRISLGNESKNIADILVDDLLAAERNDLVQQRLRIAHAAF